jgi:hypothetical protein
MREKGASMKENCLCASCLHSTSTGASTQGPCTNVLLDGLYRLLGDRSVSLEKGLDSPAGSFHTKLSTSHCYCMPGFGAISTSTCIDTASIFVPNRTLLQECQLPGYVLLSWRQVQALWASVQSLLAAYDVHDNRVRASTFSFVLLPSSTEPT